MGHSAVNSFSDAVHGEPSAHEASAGSFPADLQRAPVGRGPGSEETNVHGDIHAICSTHPRLERAWHFSFCHRMGSGLCPETSADQSNRQPTDAYESRAAGGGEWHPGACNAASWAAGAGMRRAGESE